MRKLLRIFDRWRRAGPCEVHPDDAALVQPEDLAWWRKLSLAEAREYERNDNMRNLISYRALCEDQGMAPDEAMQRIAISSPRYYLTLDRRAAKSVLVRAEDARIPYVLRYRVDDGIIAGVFPRDAIFGAGSFNALIRQLIRNRQL